VELPNINNQKAYAKGLDEMPDWRIGCIFTGSGHRRSGVARAAVSAALAAIHDAGGGIVEAYPEQVEGRAPSAVPISIRARPTCPRSSASSETGW
jgi:hypothetical protein